MAGRAVEDVLADYACGLRLDELPPDVVAKARLCLVDFMASALTVKDAPEALAALHVMEGGVPRATVFGAGRALPAADAAFVTSTACSSTSRNDTYIATASHPGAVIYAAVLALAEEVDASGEEVLAAAVAGYEIMERIGRAVIAPQTAAVFRPTSWTGAAAAGTACARLLGLDPTRTANAIALAANGAAGLNQWAIAGTNESFYHSGGAARAGIIAARLAQAGVPAARGSLDGPAGLLAAMGRRDHAGALLDGLATRHRIIEVTFKPAPACIFAQGPSQVAAALAARRIQPADKIRGVEVRVTEAAARYPGCDFAGPFERKVSAQLSIQFCVASILSVGEIRDATWDDHRNPEFAALARRTRLVADAELDAAYPARNGTRIAVVYEDGRRVEAGQAAFDGMTQEAIETRFLAAAETTGLSEEGAGFLASIRKLEEAAGIRSTLASLRGAAATGEKAGHGP